MCFFHPTTIPNTTIIVASPLMNIVDDIGMIFSKFTVHVLEVVIVRLGGKSSITLVNLLNLVLGKTDSLGPLEQFPVLPWYRAESKLVDPQSKSHEGIHTQITECLVAAATSPSSGNRKG